MSEIQKNVFDNLTEQKIKMKKILQALLQKSSIHFDS